jgi:regulator of sigma E protease
MSWLYIFFGFSALIILHEAGHFVAAKATGMRVERFFLFFPPKLVSMKRGETEYGIGAIPAGGFVKITGMNPEEELPPDVASRGYYHQPVWKRIVVIGAGPAVNIVLAFAILWVLALGASDLISKVDGVLPGSPAAGAAIRQGDEIVAVDGKRYAGMDRESRLVEFREAINHHKCAGRQVDACSAATPATITLRRGGELRTISVRPKYDAGEERSLIGIRYAEAPAHLGIGGAASRAADTIWEVASRTVTVFGRIVEPQERKEVSGVVGVSDVAHQGIEKHGARWALTLLAIVSLSLGLINLFPFLPLDGGHIFWSLVEKLRGRPVPFRVMERASVIGFVLVIMLFFVGLSNDIGRITGEGFNVR